MSSSSSLLSSHPPAQQIRQRKTTSTSGTAFVGTTNKTNPVHKKDKPSNDDDLHNNNNNQEEKVLIQRLQSKIIEFESHHSNMMLEMDELQQRIQELETGSNNHNHNHNNHSKKKEETTNQEREHEQQELFLQQHHTKELPQDSFSFILIADPLTLPFCTGIFVFGIQISIFLLVAGNIIDFENNNNPFNFPVNVSIVVRITQIVAIFISVLTQDDIRTGLFLMHEGLYYILRIQQHEHEHEQDGNTDNTMTSEPITNQSWKFIVSVGMRCLEGTLGLLVTFLLVMTEETVIDLILNFAAMEFVSQLDESTFFLSKQGFLGKENSTLSKYIETTKFITYKQQKLLTTQNEQEEEEEEEEDEEEQQPEALETPTGTSQLKRRTVTMKYHPTSFSPRNSQLQWESTTTTGGRRKKKKQLNYHTFLLLIILTVMFILWGSVVHLQITGKLLCDTLYVQFSDDYLPGLGTFSGLYDKMYSQTRVFSEHRVIYIERHVKKSMFAYCNPLNVWTFTYVHEEENDSSDPPAMNMEEKVRQQQERRTHGNNVEDVLLLFDPCDWRARSSPTNSFDLAETSSLVWYARDDGESREMELQYFQLLCFDCDYNVMTTTTTGATLADSLQLVDVDDAFHFVEGKCLGRGYCSNAVCTCFHGYYGLRCEFAEPCTSIEIDNRLGEFTSNRLWSNNYDRLYLDESSAEEDTTTTTNNNNHAPIDVYYRPVYIHEYDTDRYDIILFTGRRWVITYSDMLPIPTTNDNHNNRTVKNALGIYLRDEFHGYFTRFAFTFISEPVDFFTSTDIDSAPIGIQWYSVLSTPELFQNQNLGFGRFGIEMDVRLLCITCHNITNPCMYDGICLKGTNNHTRQSLAVQSSSSSSPSSSSYCQCAIGSSGSFCEIPPIGNGRCDPYYNTMEFKYDGGDCCESTCISTSDYFCGLDDTGLVTIGYYFCGINYEHKGDSSHEMISTNKEEDKYDDHKWELNGNPIVGDTYSKSGYSISISGNGKLLLIGEPLADRVYLFDKDGSKWIIRGGRPIYGPVGSGFGVSVAISSGLQEVMNNRFSFTTTTIVVGASKRFTEFSSSPDEYGFVRVYECTTHGCSQLKRRSNINGGNNTNSNNNADGNLWDFQSHGNVIVDISGDGRIITAGILVADSDSTFSSNDNDNNNSQKLVVFERIGHNSWYRRPIREDVHGKSISSSPLYAAGPYSLSLSRNGNKLAVGLADAKKVNVDAEEGTFQVEGTDTKLLYVWNGTMYNIQKGSTIVDILHHSNNDDDKNVQISSSLSSDITFQSRSIALNDDGNILAIGLTAYNSKVGSGGVFVFNWDDTNFRWMPMGSKIQLLQNNINNIVVDSNNGNNTDSNNHDHSDSFPLLEGWSVALSSDGLTIAIGVGRSGGFKYSLGGGSSAAVDSGSITVRRWNEVKRSWEQIGAAIPSSGAESVVSLSSDGYMLALGLPFFQTKHSGTTFIYEYPSHICSSSTSTSKFRASLTTDDFPGDTTWDIEIIGFRDGKNITATASSTRSPANATTVTTETLTTRTTRTINHNDSTFTDEIFLLQSASGGPYGNVGGKDSNSDNSHNNFLTFLMYETCIPRNSCIIFTIYDKLDLFFTAKLDIPDGMNDPSTYNLFINGQQIIANRLNGAVDRIYIGGNGNSDNNNDEDYGDNPCSKLLCPSGSQQFRMLLRSCIPVSWTLVLNDHDIGDSSSISEQGLLFENNNFDDFKKGNSNDDNNDNCRTYWEEICLPPSHFDTFSSINVQEENDNIDDCAVTLTYTLWYNNDNDIELDSRKIVGNLPVNLEYRLFIEDKEITAQGESHFMAYHLKPGETVNYTIGDHCSQLPQQ